MSRPILFLLAFCMLRFTGPSSAGITYHHYYDSTTQWRTYAGGWGGFYGYAQYYTVYFDGDTLIGGIGYYRQKTIQLDSVFSWGNPKPVYVDTTLYTAGFIREDSSHKVWYHNAAKARDELIFDYGLATSPGDTFSLPGSNCIMGYIDSVYLGSMPLKRVRPLINTDSFLQTRGWVEGVGVTGGPCGSGIESDRFTVCFMRQGQTLKLSQYMPCGAFLEPVYSKPEIDRHDRSNRTDGNGHPGAPTLSAANQYPPQLLDVYPNPATNVVHLRAPLPGTGTLVLTDITGRQVMELPWLGSERSIPLAGLPSGSYQVRLVQSGSVRVGRFIKQ